jgi:hypothetical protein
MATFTTALASRLAKCAGSYTEIAFGLDLTAATTATITVPQMGKVLAVVVGNNQSASTLPFADTPVGNTFVITKGSGDAVTWIAFGTARY